MQIGVRGTFSFSEIFGGKLNLTTTCNLAISQPYSLIYAEMTNLDVIAVLNEAFGLGLAGQSLIVTSAGFFTFSTSGGGSSQATLQSIFPNSPVPATVSSTATPVTDTSSFWLTVQLSDTDGDDSNDGLFISLVDIGVSSGTQLSLSATFASGAVAGTAIKSADYALSLDGEVELFGIFTFQDVVINYSIAEFDAVVGQRHARYRPVRQQFHLHRHRLFRQRNPARHRRYPGAGQRQSQLAVRRRLYRYFLHQYRLQPQLSLWQQHGRRTVHGARRLRFRRTGIHRLIVHGRHDAGAGQRRLHPVGLDQRLVRAVHSRGQLAETLWSISLCCQAVRSITTAPPNR